MRDAQQRRKEGSRRKGKTSGCFVGEKPKVPTVAVPDRRGDEDGGQSTILCDVV